MNSQSTAATSQSISRGRKKQQQCLYCQRTYQKHEHLVRHERTHTGQKPFVCRICNKPFARRDTLLRHERVHVTTTDTDPGQQLVSASPNQATGQGATGSQESNEWGILQLQNLTPASSADGAPNLEPMDLTVMDSGNVPQFLETEDFLQYLLSNPAGWPIPTSAGASPENLRNNSGAVPSLRDDGQHSELTVEPSPPALLQMDAVITDMSSNFTREIKTKGVTSTFLDTCLCLFFSRFNPTFPIMHEATWELKDCGPYLLLNMVAIGSLFIGTSDAIAKGEFLWRLAQAAAATFSLSLERRTAGDRFSGAQLVTTALLGQVYAMSSRSEKLRMTCPALHGHAFSWARQFGMYELKEFTIEDLPESTATSTKKMEKWKIWASLEVQRRSVLGLYIVDAQLARYTGGAPIGRHVTNPLPCSSREAIFRAQTADDWITEMNQGWMKPSSFREVFLSTFDLTPQPTIGPTSHFSIHVLLEGLQAILSEKRDAGGSALGIPSSYQITNALLRVHDIYVEMSSTSVESLELLLRWHALCLDLATDAVLLCRKVCARYGVEQTLFCHGQASALTIDLEEWACSKEARRALLHALSIQDIAERLPISRAHAPHIPACIFAAVTVYSALSSTDQTEVPVPESINWAEVWDCDDSAVLGDSNANIGLSPLSDCKLFVRGLPLRQPKPKSRNLRYSLYTLQDIIRSISSQWGMSQEMLRITLCWTSPTS